MPPYDQRVAASSLLSTFFGCVLSLLLGSLPGFGASPGANLGAAEQALLQGKVDEAVGSLHGILQAEPKNAPAHLLLCRAFLSEELADPAVKECEAAASLQSGDSATQDWLGRAYGLKASRAGPLSGFSLARKVRDAFEAAVRLNPHSGDAFDDLGEFYVEAPGIVGGGLDKANALAAQGAGILPQRARALRAVLAEKQRDYTTAEREYRTLVQENNRPDAWIDMGQFYGRRHQNEPAAAAIRHAIEMDSAHDNSLAHAGEVLIRLKLEPQLAERALRDYLGGSNLSDSAPACKVHTLLGRLLASSGDKAGARMEFQKALTLASGYEPAKKELVGL